MNNVVCKDCGAEASSKCPFCRTVFPVNQTEAVLSHLLKFKTDEHQRVTISYHWYGAEYKSERENVTDALRDLHSLLNRMADESKPEVPNFEEYSCPHRWVFKEGHKSLIGCGH